MVNDYCNCALRFLKLREISCFIYNFLNEKKNATQASFLESIQMILTSDLVYIFTKLLKVKPFHPIWG